jgi:hypothetical protein
MQKESRGNPLPYPKSIKQKRKDITKKTGGNIFVWSQPNENIAAFNA